MEIIITFENFDTIKVNVIDLSLYNVTKNIEYYGTCYFNNNGLQKNVYRTCKACSFTIKLNNENPDDIARLKQYNDISMLTVENKDYYVPWDESQLDENNYQKMIYNPELDELTVTIEKRKKRK